MSILVNGKSYPQLADLERALHRMMGGLPKQEQIKQLDGEELITFSEEVSMHLNERFFVLLGEG